MKSLLMFVAVLILAQTALAGKREESLEKEMQALDLSDRAPSLVSSEKLYSVQTRAIPLARTQEVLFGGGVNLTGNGFLNTQQVELGYRYHFGNRFALAGDYAFVANQLSSSAERLRATDQIVPDVPYARSRADVMAEVNLFYGKVRLSSERVTYFDQYVAAGPGLIALNTGTVPAAVADVGLAVWMHRHASARIGLKDYAYSESYRSGATFAQNLHAHLDLGVLF